eukprot:3299214-Pyramimonas_sp.AAC.1
MGAFLRSCKLPWIVAGDMNASPEQFWKSGWPQKLGAQIVTIPDGFTCFKADAQPSLIDYVLMSHDAIPYFESLRTVSVPWKPHVGQ